MAVYLGSNRVCTQGGTKNITGSGTDTSDATATASDIAKDKTAYVNGSKITGTVSTVDGISSIFAENNTNYMSLSGDTFRVKYTFANDELYRSGSQFCIDHYATTLGNATAADVVSGKTFTSANGIKITGTHSCSSGSTTPTLQSKSVSPSESSQTVTPDSGYDGLSQVTVSAISNTYVGSGITKKAAATYTPSTSNQTIASGQYLNGVQTIKGDSNLVASNIKSGVSIFGVSGSYTASSSGIDTSDATATASDILSGKTAYVNGNKVTGTITSQAAQTITPGTSDKTIASGKYLSGTQTIKGDANLVAANIKSGVSIFGVAGSYTGSGSGGGLVMKSGTTTSATIGTGLSSIKVIIIYKDSFTATGLIQGVYVTDEDKLHYTYCSQYSSYFRTCAASTSTASSVSGGTFTLGTSGTSGLSSNTTYNWIAFGEA